MIAAQGYLGTCLISQCGLKVTCIEGNEQRVDSANIREKKLLQSHDGHMTTISMTLDASSESRVALAQVISDIAGKNAVSEFHNVVRCISQVCG